MLSVWCANGWERQLISMTSGVMVAECSQSPTLYGRFDLQDRPPSMMPLKKFWPATPMMMATTPDPGEHPFIRALADSRWLSTMKSAP